MQWLIKKIVGTKNARDVRKLQPIVDEINALEEEFQNLSESQLLAKTDEFRQRITDGETLDEILPEAFATVKNACRRMVGRTFDLIGNAQTWVEVPYDVQLVGGIAMHTGRIAEMATGEGKTLVAVAPVYLNALTGKGVHVVTVNDYLARRDARWMGELYEYLGLSVGCIQSQMKPEKRREMYNMDITYGTNSEFGFDYLRDNMAFTPEAMVQRGHFYAIIDEIDSILIDEARTPLIISGPTDISSEQVYREFMPHVQKLTRKQDQLITKLFKQAEEHVEAGNNDAAMEVLYQLKQGAPRHQKLLAMAEEASTLRLMEKAENRYISDTFKEQARVLREELFFTIEEKHHEAALTDKGRDAMSPADPEAYVLPDLPTLFSELDGDTEIDEQERAKRRAAIQDDYAERSQIIHAVDQLIKAFNLYIKDVNYIVEDNKVVIVDENTGRKMAGRRWSDGLHQAVEAKEGTNIERETQTYATITIQNYFRMYDKLSGMTGTAETEADEFMSIYDLDVMVIPTNRPTRRIDYTDLVFRTQREKDAAIVEEIIECHRRGQPVLVGTVSVEASERLSRMLEKKRIIHNVLNAKQHEREAEIVGRAGAPGAVTIATNMAGRGTDIKLGKGVIKWPKEVHDSYLGLDDKYQGKTLFDILVDDPGGLHVIGTERNDSRRVDRQLRGRCSRQGDPGSARFYVSLEDKLMRQFGSDRVSNILNKLGGMEEGEAIESGMLSKVIERSQRKVEQWHFSIRKKTLEYDDVMNAQREIVYGRRSDALTSGEPRNHIYQFLDEQLDSMIAQTYDPSIRLPDAQDWDVANTEFAEWMMLNFPVAIKTEDLAEHDGDQDAIHEMVLNGVKAAYEVKCAVEDPDQLPAVERYIVLKAIDENWQEYLREFDAVRQGIGLMGYAQKDPIVEFKHRAYTMFAELMDKISNDVVRLMFRVGTERAHSFMANRPKTSIVDADPLADAQNAVAAQNAAAAEARGREAAMQQALQPVRREEPKVGRNDPCPCGSGKKYKKCHGRA